MDTIGYFFAKAPGKQLALEADAGFGYRFETFAKFSGGQGKSAKSELTRKVDQTIAKIKGTILGSDLGKRLMRHLLTEIKAQIVEIIAFLSDECGVLCDECNYTPKVA